MDSALAERVIANLLEQNEAQKAQLSQACGTKLSHEDLYAMLPLRRCDHTDTYAGAPDAPVADPYRWLEEDSEETRDWVKAQQTMTRHVFAQCPGRDRLKARLLEAYNYEKMGCPKKRGERYFWFHNSGL